MYFKSIARNLSYTWLHKITTKMRLNSDHDNNIVGIEWCREFNLGEVAEIRSCDFQFSCLNHCVPIIINYIRFKYCPSNIFHHVTSIAEIRLIQPERHFSVGDGVDSGMRMISSIVRCNTEHDQRVVIALIERNSNFILINLAFTHFNCGSWFRRWLEGWFVSWLDCGKIRWFVSWLDCGKIRWFVSCHYSVPLHEDFTKRICISHVGASFYGCLLVRFPSNYKVSVGKTCNCRSLLVSSCELIDLELKSTRIARIAETLCKYTSFTPVLISGIPSNYKASVSKNSNIRNALTCTRVRVDFKFISNLVPGAVVSSRIHTRMTAVLNIGLPSDHKVPIRKKRDLRSGLTISDICIHFELGS